jgi:hypothetical protein
MATRGARTSPEHVQALNMIDFEFYGNGAKDRAVLEAWNEHRDHLNTPYTAETVSHWVLRQDELFVELLVRMSLCLGYRFDRRHIKNSAYSPVAHGNLERDQNIIRAGLVDLFSKRFAVPVLAVPATKQEADEQSRIRELLTEYLQPDRCLKVEIVDNHRARPA